jgi:23S rRNA (cytidine1920-2'-O)/16S rRNA (cytidine1409-2'-O)-methyltransferase
MRQRLDQYLVTNGLAPTRSQAENLIRMGEVTVDGRVETKASRAVPDDVQIKVTAKEQYVSRAGLKLASVADKLKLDFTGKVVLDVGSSTGGFTDYALQHGAAKVIAVEVGKNQLHPSLHGNPQIELHEQTDIRHFKTDRAIDIVVGDVSFVSLREILPAVKRLSSPTTQIAVMVKPQFEAFQNELKHKGVIKNEKVRRDILKSFEAWAKNLFVVLDKADSDVPGTKGNRERFYLLRAL